MKKPDLNSKKYKYWHKRLGKWMVNNELYMKDVRAYREYQDKQNGTGPVPGDGK